MTATVKFRTPPPPRLLRKLTTPTPPRLLQLPVLHPPRRRCRLRLEMRPLVKRRPRLRLTRRRSRRLQGCNARHGSASRCNDQPRANVTSRHVKSSAYKAKSNAQNGKLSNHVATYSQLFQTRFFRLAARCPSAPYFFHIATTAITPV